MLFIYTLPGDTIRICAYIIVPRTAPGRAVPAGRGAGEVHEVASAVLVPVHAANWIVPRTCHAVKRIDGLVLLPFGTDGVFALTEGFGRCSSL